MLTVTEIEDAAIAEPDLWERWVATRPPVIQELARRFPPTRTYVLRTTTQIVHIISYYENGTMKVGVVPAENPHLVCALPEPYEVFGIEPADLEVPC